MTNPVDEALERRHDVKTLASLADVPLVEVVLAIEAGELQYESTRDGLMVSLRDWHAYRINTRRIMRRDHEIERSELAVEQPKPSLAQGNATLDATILPWKKQEA